MNKVISSLLCCFALACSACSSATATADTEAAVHEDPVVSVDSEMNDQEELVAIAETEAEVHEKLVAFAESYLQSYAKALRPNRDAPAVSERDGKYVATYIELDLNSIQTELLPAQSGGFSYLAKMTYVEYFYEAVGDTRQQALQGDFQRVLTRRLTEIPRYSRGIWSN